MYTRTLKILCTMLLLVMVTSTYAQVLKISAFNQEGSIIGDFSKKEINNASAGYVDFNSVSGIEINYYPKNKIGYGLRWTGSYYGRDIETYESDIKDMLGISDNNYDLTQGYAFWTFGSDFGISYLHDISEKWQLEPYFYLGFKLLATPMSSVVYSQNNTTYQYQSKSNLYIGYSYSPGVKLHWNIAKHVGLYFSVEYDGKSFLEDEERSMTYSYNTFEITDTKKKYKINSLNIGLGLAFRFGKGLEVL